MSNALSAHEDTYVSSWEILLIHGADSTDLLNRLLSLDIKRLNQSQGSWAFLLDHRGQVRQALWLIKRSETEYLAVSETGIAELEEALDMFIFSEDVTLSRLNNHCCVYLSKELPNIKANLEREPLREWTSHPIAIFSPLATSPNEAETAPQERLLIGPKEGLPTLNLRSMSDADFNLFRVSQGGALPSREYRSGTPLDVSLMGISEGKGCYPGQEVIERTIAIGKPAQVTIPVMIHLSDIDQLQIFINGEPKGGNSYAIFESQRGGERGREIGVVTSIGSVIEGDHSAYSIEALVKLKSRAAHFEEQLECELALPQEPNEQWIKASIARR